MVATTESLAVVLALALAGTLLVLPAVTFFPVQAEKPDIKTTAATRAALVRFMYSPS